MRLRFLWYLVTTPHLYALFLGVVIAWGLLWVVAWVWSRFDGGTPDVDRFAIWIWFGLGILIAIPLDLVMLGVLDKEETAANRRPTRFTRSAHAWKALNGCNKAEQRELKAYISEVGKTIDTRKLARRDENIGRDLLNAWKEGESAERFVERLGLKRP